MDRKEFIKTCGFACLTASIPAILLQSYPAIAGEKNYVPTGEIITIPKSDFFETKKGKQKEKKYVVVKNDHFEFPIGIYKLPDDCYTALLLQCTHKGCELDPQGDFMVCPCHGSEFNKLGEVQNPPAEENLKPFKTSTDNENIYIHL